MRLTRHPIADPLRPYVDSIWVFESGEGVPASSSRVVAPNGKPKLVLSFRNALDVRHARGFQEGREGRLHVIGVWDEASTISSAAQSTGTIGIEFHPEGLARFAGFPLHEIANRVLDSDTVFGNEGRDLEAALERIPSVEGKVAQLQAFLVRRLGRVRPVHPALDHALKRLRQTHGSLGIRDLERETGFSARWLDRLFQEHVGHSPKTLAAICRFQRYYAAWALDSSPRVFQEDLLDLYYDQSHFSREFKRFTGSAPGRYARTDNEFGRIFYQNRSP